MIINSSILSFLFCLVSSNPPPEVAYETAQVRRTAASVLAVLSRSHPYTMRCALLQQHCNVEEWLQRAACVQDLRTRASALIVKEYLCDVATSSCSAVGSDARSYCCSALDDDSMNNMILGNSGSEGLVR